MPAADMSATDTDGTQPPPSKKPRKTAKDPANASRIRDNQRRSRARRKEYVEELQRQVQEYEKHGVQASLDIQKAAKSVSLENARLRMLLAQRGVPGPEVDAYLRSFENGPPDAISLPGGEYPDPGVKREQSHPPPPHLQQQQQQQQQQHHHQPPPPPHSSARALDPLSVLADASTQLQISSTTPTSSAPSQYSRDGRSSCCPPSTATSVSSHQPITPSHQSVSNGHNGYNGGAYGGPAASPLQMSCNAAARIIADMQGHSDHRQARASLGCNPRDSDCVVSNVSLFSILDHQ